jgi:drug/metabolite transporter (DMT)-like permease
VIDAGAGPADHGCMPLVLFVLLWSSGYVVGALGVDAAPPLALLTIRFAIAIGPVIFLATRVDGWRRAPLGRLAVVGLLLQGVQFSGVYGGLSLGVPAALSSLIVLGLAPVATIALTTLAGLERTDTRAWLLLGTGVGGVLLSLAPELGSAHIGAGAALTVVGMLGLSGGTVLQKHWAGQADARVAVAAQLTAAAALIVPVSAATGELGVQPSLQLGWTALWLAFPLSIGATMLFVKLLDRYDANTVTSLLLAVPAVTAVESALVLGERLQPVSLLGMAVSIAAVYGVVSRQAPRRSEARPPRPAAEPSRRPSPRPSRASAPRLRARPTPARR